MKQMVAFVALSPARSLRIKGGISNEIAVAQMSERLLLRLQQLSRI